MNRKGAPTLGVALPWNFSDIPGRGSLTTTDTVNRVGYSPSTWQSFTPFGTSRRLGRKPGTGRSRGGLGDAEAAPGGGPFQKPTSMNLNVNPGTVFWGGLQINGADDLDEDSSLGLSFNVPSLVSNFNPMPSSLAPVTPASGASSFWDPLSTLLNFWNSRPQVVKDIRLRVNPVQAIQAAQTILPPGKVGDIVNSARAMGLDPSFLTKYGEVPITGNMAEYGYRAQGFDWQAYLPWIAGGAAAIFILPMLMKR